MHILLVIDGMHPRLGGPPAVVAGSAAALAALGHNVTILTSAQAGDDEAVAAAWPQLAMAGVTLINCEPDGIGGYFGISGQHQRLADVVNAVDVIHVHGLWSPLYTHVGRMARRQRIPCFFSSHGLLDHRAMGQNWRKWLKKRLAVRVFGYRSLLADSAGIIFGSAAEAEESWRPAPDIVRHVVPNGADPMLGTIPAQPTDRARLIAAVPAVADWQRLVLCRSRIYPTKGLDRIIAAFVSVAAEFPDAGLLIAGLAQDVDHQRALEAAIRASSFADRIALTTALTGPSSQFLYQIADVYAAPSNFEGFSMAIIEGLANGRPMLITRYCHNPAVAEVGAGVIVEPDVSGLADGLRQLLVKSDQELAGMGLQARALFEARFTWPRVADALVRLYAGAVQSAMPA